MQAPRRRLFNRLLIHSRRNQAHNMVIRGTPESNIAVIHRRQDTEPNMGIIRIILHHLRHHMGIPLISGRRILAIPHSPCQLGILHRRRRLLLPPSSNKEEIVVDKENEEKLAEFSSMFSFACAPNLSASNSVKVCAFILSRCVVVWFVHNFVFLL
jgi:hypothetical protein